MKRVVCENADHCELEDCDHHKEHWEEPMNKNESCADVADYCEIAAGHVICVPSRRWRIKEETKEIMNDIFKGVFD